MVNKPKSPVVDTDDFVDGEEEGEDTTEYETPERAKPTTTLTELEKEAIVQFHKEGKTPSQIGELMNKKWQTVKKHLRAEELIPKDVRKKKEGGAKKKQKRREYLEADAIAKGIIKARMDKNVNLIVDEISELEDEIVNLQAELAEKQEKVGSLHAQLIGLVGSDGRL